MKHRSKRDRQAALQKRAKLLSTLKQENTGLGETTQYVATSSAVVKPSVSYESLLGYAPRLMYQDLLKTAIVTAIVALCLGGIVWWFR